MKVYMSRVANDLNIIDGVPLMKVNFKDNSRRVLGDCWFGMYIVESNPRFLGDGKIYKSIIDVQQRFLRCWKATSVDLTMLDRL